MGINQKFNPAHAGLETERICEPCIITIFGASGSLTKRKLMPALFSLYIKGNIPEGSKIIGLSRAYKDHNDFREAMKEDINEIFKDTDIPSDSGEKFFSELFYLNANFSDGNSYRQLKDELETLEKNGGSCGNRLFYFATPPEVFETIIDNLHEQGLNRPVSDNCWTRIVIEKPFGRDLESAQKLNKKIGRVFREKQIYRIDHYLGKETVQNLLVFRFGNSIFEPIWNRNYIDHVQITAAETIGIENRAAYYNNAGALRDMVPNHLFQLLALIAMEPPVTFEADIVRDEKVQVFHAIQPIKADEIEKFVVKAQYSSGKIEGEHVKAYIDEKGVPGDSNTETYAALKLFVQNWRWAGVPFYIRTGKRMPKFVTDITLFFKKTPHMIFRMLAKDVHDTNILSIQIQPDETITLSFNAKLPGSGMNIKPVIMDFDYYSAFGTKLSNAYEKLLQDCLTGDQTLYSRRDGVEAAWAIIDNILKHWESANSGIPLYHAGSWGSKESDELMQRDGRRWKIL
jgi:glucose-6-phosphate 1-dehydrogenase